MENEYLKFVRDKLRKKESRGIAVERSSLDRYRLFDFQIDLTAWALRRGRAAIFASTGLGKTRMQLAWANEMRKHTDGIVMIIAPLAVAQQTVIEASSIGVTAKVCRDESDCDTAKICVTNYDRLHRFETLNVCAVVLDESSIIKHYNSKTLKTLMGRFSETPYRLCATATPSPNDHMELATHAEFLGVCTRAEMLAEYFVHDGENTSQWRIKGHARKDFWKFVASWGAMIRNPSDLGYDGSAYNLPSLSVQHHVVESDDEDASREAGVLFIDAIGGLTQRRAVRRTTIQGRADEVAKIVNADREKYIVWCELNAECEAIMRAVPDAVEVKGADSPDDKEKTLTEFSRGDHRVLVSKPSICGWGLNWQHVNRVIFAGVSDSWESYHQAIRRCWRFGQKREVDVHLIYARREMDVVRNLERKEMEAKTMGDELSVATASEVQRNIHDDDDCETPLEMVPVETPSWASVRRAQDVGLTDRSVMLRGDCVMLTSQMADESIDYSVFSPPFSSLYTYSDSEFDMGNTKSNDLFFRQFRFLMVEVFRVLRTGRNVSIHCMDIPTSKSRDGVIGLYDFRGDIVRMMGDLGFVLHSQVTIWKDPVTAMQRTHAIGLLHKQLKKDSAMSRMGIPDYVCTFRKPGENRNPVTHTNESFPVSEWQKIASPVWMDIVQSETLQYMSAREHEDERHICPLQLEVIERCLKLWTNPDDIVLSPFAGIGSEGYVALKMGRRFVGCELKGSYFKQAVLNLKQSIAESGQVAMFGAP